MTHASPFVTQAHPARERYRAPAELIAPDAIIIGAGLGGLALGSILAQRRQMKCLVLEAGPVPGGCTSVHELGGFEFNKGLHSVGDMDVERNPNALHRYVADYITGNQVQWARMPEQHEVAAIGDDVYPWYSNVEENIASFGSRFPGYEEKIRRYYQLEEKVQAGGMGWGLTKLMPQWVPEPLRRAMFAVSGGGWVKYMNRPVTEVLGRELGFSPELITLFSYMYGNYGRTPGFAPFTMHASVMYHYRFGSYYPVGGPAQLASTIIPIIERAGGQVAVSTPVKEILVEGNRAVGVRLENGHEVRAKVVISDASAYETFMRLLPREVSARHGYPKMFEVLTVSPAHVYMFLGYDEVLPDLPRHIVWQLPDFPETGKYDIDRADRIYKDQQRFLQGPGYVIAPSARDPSFPQRYGGKSTVIVLSEAGVGWVEKAKRDPGFARELEARATEGMMDTALRHVPSLRGKRPAFLKVGTPVGCNVRAKDGCSYGAEASAERFTRFTHRLRPQTRVEGLYLTGQDCFFPGIAGVMLSARVTYCAMTGDFMHFMSKERSPLRLPATSSAPPEAKPESARPAA